MSIKENRVLALSMRPRSLSELVGQEDLVSSLQTQFTSKRIPHFFILSGPVGAGKTTLARIIALCLQSRSKEFGEFSNEDWRQYKKYDISEINAANKNGVDDMRSLVEVMKFKPMAPSKAKVVILDEAHQLTNAAQNALITETEDVADHVYYIFCTSAINKIIPALKRRAFVITPKPLSSSEVIESLLERAKTVAKYKGSSEELNELKSALVENDITSPGLVVQAADRFFSGIPALDSVTFTESSKFDPMSVCRAVSSGNWSACSAQLRDVTKSDVYMLRSSILGYLKAILLKANGGKAVALSKAIAQMTSSTMEDSICLPSFLSSVCLACYEITKTSASSNSTSAVKPVATTASIASTTPVVKPAVKPVATKTPAASRQIFKPTVTKRKRDDGMMDEP